MVDNIEILFLWSRRGWLLNSSYGYLKNAELDLAIFDCTVGNKIGDYRVCEHNSICMRNILISS